MCNKLPRKVVHLSDNSKTVKALQIKNHSTEKSSNIKLRKMIFLMKLLDFRSINQPDRGGISRDIECSLTCSCFMSLVTCKIARSGILRTNKSLAITEVTIKWPRAPLKCFCHKLFVRKLFK